MDINNRQKVTVSALMAVALLILTLEPVSAHGAEGADREKMDLLLQSLFNMRSARRGSDLSAIPRQIPDKPLAAGLDLSAIPSHVDTTWLLRSRPQLQHEEISPGLLRVSGASAMRSSQGLGSAAGGGTKTKIIRARSIPAIGEVADAGVPSTFRQYEYVRDLRRKFEREQEA